LPRVRAALMAEQAQQWRQKLKCTRGVESQDQRQPQPLDLMVVSWVQFCK
jgi:hypothetical protein